MKNMILVETDAEVDFVKKLWMQLQDDIAAGRGTGYNCIGDGIPYTDNGACEMKICPNAIVYHHHNGENGEYVWDIYNFQTGVRQTVEGDLAGLANSADGMFPLFN